MGAQLLNRANLQARKVLLIDRCQATREARAAVLRSHGVEVLEAKEICAGRFLWQPHVYVLVMLDVRRYSPAEAREFYEQIRTANSQQQFAILMGSPGYLSRIWPGEGTAGDTARGQWGEAVKRFVAAA